MLPPHRSVIPVKPVPSEWSNDRVTLSWLGHATLYANLNGTCFLTDPALVTRVGVQLLPGVVLGPKRMTPPALRISELPRIDFILLSHAHMDHIDNGTLRQLPKTLPVITAKGTADLLRRLGYREIIELSRGESIRAAGARLTALPVNHWGRRYPWEPVTRRDACAYRIEKANSTLFFAGDSAYPLAPFPKGDGQIDVAIFGIGGYDPFVHAHATPEQVWTMYTTLQARHLVPIHWGTFQLSQEPVEDPIHRLLKAAAGRANEIVIREIGETFELPQGGLA